MKLLFFIVFPLIDKKKLLINNAKKRVFIEPKEEFKLFCRYDSDCTFPMTCYKIINDYGICHYDRKKTILIPIRIPIPIDD